MKKLATPEMTLNRRNFLKIAAAGGITAGVASMTGCSPQSSAVSDASTGGSAGELGASSWRTAPDPIDESSITNTQEADVIIVGGGIAGVSTAASALENGLSVIVLEKNEQPRMTGLDFGCVNPQIAIDAGLELSEEDIHTMTREWVALSANRARADIVLNFIRNSGAAIDWLSEKAVEWGCTPVIAAMKREGDMYTNWIRTVEFHNGPLFDIAAGSYGVNDVITMLQQEITDNGGQYLTHITAEQLEKDDSGRVTSVVARNDDGTYTRFNGFKGVVLCTGDFGADAEMLNDLTCFDFDSYDDTSLLMSSTETGDGHKMGVWAGAAWQMGPQPLMLLPMTYPYFYLHVNDRGERFCNEDVDSVNMCINQLAQHSGAAWSIWDAKWPEEIPASLEFGGGMSWDQDFRIYGDPWSEETEQATLDFNEEMGMLFVADTLEELADAAGIPKDAFLATVERYNKLAEAGKDDDFGKRSELMTSISEPPFYALRMQTMLCVSVGGLNVDIDSNVLDNTGAPIEGLYAVGNTAGGLFGVDYIESVVPGVSLGRCVTFGKLLGEHLAQA